MSFEVVCILNVESTFDFQNETNVSNEKHVFHHVYRESVKFTLSAAKFSKAALSVACSAFCVSLYGVAFETKSASL